MRILFAAVALAAVASPARALRKPTTAPTSSPTRSCSIASSRAAAPTRCRPPSTRRRSTSTAPRWRSATPTFTKTYIDPGAARSSRRCGRRTCRPPWSIRSAAATSRSALVTYPDAPRDHDDLARARRRSDPARRARPRASSARRCRRTATRSTACSSLHDSTSENMRKLEIGGIPGQLSFHITGMTALGYEPVGAQVLHARTTTARSTT